MGNNKGFSFTLFVRIEYTLAQSLLNSPCNMCKISLEDVPYLLSQMPFGRRSNMVKILCENNMSSKMHQFFFCLKNYIYDQI